MAETEEEKQDYLRENILDKGFEADEFADFLSVKKGQEEIDLDNWTMDELKTLVQEFFEYHKEVEEKKEKEKENVNQIQQPSNNVKDDPLNNSNFPQNNMNNSNSFNYNIISNVNYGQNIINPNINPNTNININQNMNIYQNTNINQNMNINSNINMYQNNNFSSNSNLNQNSLLNQNTNLTQNQNIGFNQFQNIDFNKNQIMNLNQNINNNFNMNMNQDAKQNLIKNITNTFGNIYAEKQDSPSQNSVQFQQNNSLNDKTDIYGITNEDYVFCGISDKSELGRAKDIKIEVTVGEKVNRKMFSKAYMTYLITTNPLNYKVNRRYSDFEWLRQTLLHLYPSNIIPPIPKKTKMGKNKFEEAYLIKRTRTLERFLNLLMKDPILKESLIIHDFLQIEDYHQFEESKKIYHNIKIPQNLSEYKNPEGKLTVNVNEENELLYNSLKENTDSNIELLNKLNKNLKLLNNEITAVTNRMDEISKNCYELFLNSAKYLDDNDIKRSYYQVKDIFKYSSNALKDQLTIININIREYFKYTRNTFRAMKVLISNVDNYKSNYLKAKKSLISKKEDLIKKPDVKKWDLDPNKANVNPSDLVNDKSLAFPLMLYNETKSVINIKQKYGYYLNRAIEEYQRLRYIISSGHKENVIENAKMIGNIINDLFTNISAIGDGNQKYDMNNIAKEINDEFIEKQNEKEKTQQKV
jgi:hypothetical protein